MSAEQTKLVNGEIVCECTLTRNLAIGSIPFAVGQRVDSDGEKSEYDAGLHGAKEGLLEWKERDSGVNECVPGRKAPSMRT